MLVSRGKALKHTDKLPFNTLLRNLANKITPLKLAMGYGSPELLSELLAAGAPVPESDQEDLLLGSGCHCPSGAMFNGRIDNMELLLKKRPEVEP